MPVERCTFLGFSYLVINSDLDSIAPVCLNCWPRKLIIDQEYRLLISIWGYNSSLDREVVTSDNSSIRCRSVRIAA
jgi:hypothetical protein